MQPTLAFSFTNSIKDCTRLGKYKNNNSRPILVKLVRSHDASSILVNHHKIPADSSYSIKPLMTAEKRANESTLLRERRALIDSCVERKNIRLKYNSILMGRSMEVLRLQASNDTPYTIGPYDIECMKAVFIFNWVFLMFSGWSSAMCTLK